MLGFSAYAETPLSTTVEQPNNEAVLGSVAATGVVNSVFFEFIYSVSGVFGTGVMNSVTIVADSDVNVQGVAGNEAIGSVSFEAESNFISPSVFGTGEIGDAITDNDTNVFVGSVAAQGSLTALAKSTMSPLYL